jgi:Tol biopolymer transport system component
MSCKRSSTARLVSAMALMVPPQFSYAAVTSRPYSSFMKRALALVIVIAAGVVPASVDSARPPQLLTFTVSHWQPGKQLMQRGGMCLARANGTNAVRLLPSPAGRDTDFGAAWSRDGRYLAFSRWFKGNRLTDIVIADGRGRVIRTLYSRGGGDGSLELDPSWSPDGRRLAFARSWRRTGIWFVNRDGSGLRQIVSGNAADPAWSPDGTTLAFTLPAEGLQTHENRSVHTIRVDGSERRRILLGAANPTWSPDGRKLAFVSVAKGPKAEIAVANSDGSGRRELTTTAALESAPAWSPDGKYIAFERGRERSSIGVIDAATGAERWTIRRPYGVRSPSWRSEVALPLASRASCSGR